MILPAFFPSVPTWITLLLYGLGFAFALFALGACFGPGLRRAWVWHSAFLAIAGLSFVVVLGSVSGSWWGAQMPFIVGAYLIAWLAGLLTPGAPAGVGVREVVLYALLHSMVSQVDLITAIVIGRIVTVSGDVVFYLWALAMRAGAATGSPVATDGN